ncbi:MAG: enoyl-CoA hydratase/isomerase family protein [Xanthomonadales bacterium]|nr:enoyl-CoA hydratase/isomerase family protein [Xanthomonadales bacterium]
MPDLQTTLDSRGVLTLTLDRPGVHNAFNAGLIAELQQALHEAEHDKQVRMLVLTGAGRSFSAGADLQWMRSQVEASEDDNRADAQRLANMLCSLNYLPKPTIARVNGHAFGGGVGLVACCDMAIAAEDARFGLTEVRLGLAPAVISPYVLRCIGERQARRWFLTGGRFDAAQARNMGLVHETCTVDSLDHAVEDLVSGILESGPHAVTATKRLIFDSAGTNRQAQEALDSDNARLIAALRVSAEGQEGLTAFLDKRSPAWLSRK